MTLSLIRLGYKASLPVPFLVNFTQYTTDQFSQDQYYSALAWSDPRQEPFRCDSGAAGYDLRAHFNLELEGAAKGKRVTALDKFVRRTAYSHTNVHRKNGNKGDNLDLPPKSMRK